MPYARKTLSDLISETAADIVAALPGSNPLLRRAVLTVLGRVLAGQHHEQFGFLDWIAKNAVPFTSSGEFLEGWAALKGIYREPATFAVFSATSAGSIANAPVANNATLLRSDGTVYIAAIGGTTDSGGNITLSLAAQIAGSAGNVAAGSTLTLQSPASGVNPSFTVGTITTNAVDLETDGSLLSRMLEAYQSAPAGGDLDDYVRWTLAVPGVTRAWCADSLAGSGTVTVYFMEDILRSYQFGLPAGINGASQNEPRANSLVATGDQLIVADALYSKRAATALVYACSPVPNKLNLTLAEVPNNTTIRGAISAAIAGLCVRKASPGGAWLSAARTRGGILPLSDIDAAIAAVPGIDHFVLISPTVDVVSSTGLISVPGNITYQ